MREGKKRAREASSQICIPAGIAANQLMNAIKDGNPT
jgi:hypothetical protein